MPARVLRWRHGPRAVDAPPPPPPPSISFSFSASAASQDEDDATPVNFTITVDRHGMAPRQCSISVQILPPTDFATLFPGEAQASSSAFGPNFETALQNAAAATPGAAYSDPGGSAVYRTIDFDATWNGTFSFQQVPVNNTTAQGDARRAFQIVLPALQNGTAEIITDVASCEVIDVTTGGSNIPRPAGISYKPTWAPSPYNYVSDLPTSGLRYNSTGTNNFVADCAAARAANKYLILAPGTYSGDFKSIQLPLGFYANGPLGSVIIQHTGPTTQDQPCMGYVIDRDFLAYGVEFRNFGDVIGYCVTTRGGWPMHNETQPYIRRCIAPGDGTGVNGKGTPINTTVYPKVVGATGPRIKFNLSRFRDCQRAFFGVSDSVIPSGVEAYHCDLPGNQGGFDLYTSTVAEFFAACNFWHDATLSISGSSGHNTLFRCCGLNTSTDINVRTSIIRLENNEAKDVISTITTADTNAAVFADLRMVTPTTFSGITDLNALASDISVSFNKALRLKNNRGHEDSQPIYGKIRGALIKGNDWDDCGSDNSLPGNGPEATGQLIKGGTNPSTAPSGIWIAMVGNHFRNMPIDAAQALGCIVKWSTASVSRIDLIFFGNEFHDCHSNATGTSDGIVRFYASTRRVLCIANKFRNCNVPTLKFIKFHDWAYTVPASDHEVSNNEWFHGANVNYTANKEMINANTGGSASIVTGRNVLHGSGGDFTATASFVGTLGASLKTYIPETVTA